MTVNLLGIRLMHRSMRADTRLLADALKKLANENRVADVARLDAIAAFTITLCEGIHHHHMLEDRALWPVIVKAAGAEVDLSDLTDDHAELDPILDEITAAARRIRSDRDAVRLMGKTLGSLADLLDEHIEEEERLLFPIITKYVSEQDWNRIDEMARKASDPRFDLPRFEQHGRPDEVAEFRRQGGPMLRIMLAIFRKAHRRRQRLILGTS